MGTYTTTPTPSHTTQTLIYNTENVADRGKATQTNMQTKKRQTLYKPTHVYPHHILIIKSTLIQSQRVGWIHISGMTRGQAQHLEGNINLSNNQSQVFVATEHNHVLYSEYSYFVWCALEYDCTSHTVTGTLLLVLLLVPDN